jgi:hypothetical protein
LSTELSACFQIHRCWRAQDKRYLLTLVRPLPQGKWSITEVEELKTVSPTKQDISKANAFAQELESFIEILEKNAEATKEFIDQSVRLEDKGWNMLRDLLWKE